MVTFLKRVKKNDLSKTTNFALEIYLFFQLVLLPPPESEEELKKPSMPRIRTLSRSQLPTRKVFNVPLLEPQSGEQKPELEVDLFEMMRNLPKKDPLFPIFETDVRKSSQKGKNGIYRVFSSAESSAEVTRASPRTARIA